MSLGKRKELSVVAKKLCRELRINQTEAEKIIWDKIRNRQLLGKKFLRQHPIFFDLRGKETFYIADFYCHELKLVVEIDGEIHKFRKKNDDDRDRIMNYLGIEVIRIINETVMNDPDTAIILIENYVIKLINSL
jgi:very-short-patch-repair endonuclease